MREGVEASLRHQVRDIKIKGGFMNLAVFDKTKFTIAQHA